MESLYKIYMFLLLIVTINGFRLPTNILPLKYKLQINTYLDEDGQGFRFTGRVRILVICKQDTNNITLHAKNLTINDEKVKVKLIHDKIELKEVKYEPDNDFMVIKATETFRKGNKYLIYIPFEAPLSESLQGYYRSSYVDQKSTEKRYLAVTQFEPTAARYAFPCFDEPEMKATFDISLGHHKNYTALSNMPIRTSLALKDQADYVLDTFETSVPTSTYLVAYTVNEFEYREAEMNNDFVFRVWARQSAMNQVEYAREVGPKILKYFEEYFGIKYPLSKMDLIAIPDFHSGAMENWGLIIFRETAMLFEPNTSSVTSQHYVTSVIAHELAHQWFGNYVTMKWWTDLWLNEGFATYVASLGVEYLHPEWNSFAETTAHTAFEVFKLDSLQSSHPVSVPIGHPSEISQIFDAISYSKGSSIIRMMHLFLGDATFKNGVSNYLKQFNYKNAEQDDLWKALTDEAHRTKALPPTITVKQIMDSWTLKTGYPMISVKRDYKSNSVEIRQRRYVLTKNEMKSDECYYIPLSFTNKKEKNFTDTKSHDWLECGGKNDQVKTLSNIAAKNDWIIVNIRLAGLYKVNYDRKNWELLIDELNSPSFKNLDAVNRGQLINDMLDLAWIGEQDYEVALRLLNYLHQEDEYLPWMAALDGLMQIDILLNNAPIYDLFRDYLVLILSPIYEKLSELNLTMSGLKLSAKITTWSCKFNVGNCVDKAVTLFMEWMEKEDPVAENPIPVNLRDAMYCAAINHGKDREWNFLWEQYKNSNVAAEKITIISALGCSTQPWFLARYLAWSLNETVVRKQDAPTVFQVVAESLVGFQLAKQFFYERITEIHTKLPDRIDRYLTPLASGLSTTMELMEMKAFVKEKAILFETASEGVKHALETIENNLQWKKTNYSPFTKQLLKTKLDLNENNK